MNKEGQPKIDILEAIQAKFRTPELKIGYGGRFSALPKPLFDRPDYHLIALQMEDERLRSNFSAAVLGSVQEKSLDNNS